MTHDEIIQKIHSVASVQLKDVPFDKGLPILRKVLWEVADEIGVDGAEVFRIYMDWLSSQKK